MKSVLALVVGAIAALGASTTYAQYWPFPASSPGVAVPCAGCASPLTMLPTYPWGGPIVGYTGRFLDSTTAHDWQGPYRTARANRTLYSPSNKRIYMQLGSGVGAYDADRFFTRLKAREKMWAYGGHPEPVEVWLKWDKWFYAEGAGSGWQTFIVDGQDRLSWFDVDDRDNVYLAYSIFGWGIVHDDGGSDGSMMEKLIQKKGGSGEPSSVINVISLKDSQRDYFAVAKGDTGTVLWNVTNASNPTRIGTLPFTYTAYAKTADRIAFLIPDENDLLSLAIYSIDDLTRREGPLQSIKQQSGFFAGVTTDGTNFYLVGATFPGLTLTTLEPATSQKRSYVQTDYVPPTDGRVAPLSITYGDGFVAVPVSGSTGQDILMYGVSGSQFTDVPFDHYFNKYYVTAPTGFAAPRAFFSNAQPLKKGSSLYLVVSAMYLGDVYEIGNLQSPDAQAPATSVTAPTAGTSLSGTVTLSATASDDVGVTSLEIRVDGVVQASIANSRNLTYSWDTTQVAYGRHTITSVAADAAAHRTTSSSVEVWVFNGITVWWPHLSPPDDGRSPRDHAGFGAERQP